MTQTIYQAVTNVYAGPYSGGVRVGVVLREWGGSFDNAFFTVCESADRRLLGRDIYGAALRFLSPLELLAEAAE